MVFAGQFRGELAAAEAGGGIGRDRPAPGPGSPHLRHGGPLGSVGPGAVPRSAESAGADRLPAADGAAHEPKRVLSRAPVPVGGVPAAGRRAAGADPGAEGPMDRRGVPGHRAPSGGGLRSVSAAAAFAGPSVSRPPGVRGQLPPEDHPDGGGKALCPLRPGGLGEPADGASQRPARGADGGDRPAPGAAPCGSGAGGDRSGPGHGANGTKTGAGARIRGGVASAAHRFSGAAPRGGAP